ncbi:TlpA disulfide reductase family protein [Aequorivita marina]|uniref:TlpA disulfide reductase family protein n=1 Tax=Aequorivita marina TaxID=3073654 RepID=UPI0028758055|nr:TlpA disulfide reductase family protein [Aequorivita sp. S2608]MDS1297117.1 TlpA disulfide reductase family protein [Aequorivita sp. S2608]
MKNLLFLSLIALTSLLGCEEKHNGFKLNGKIEGNYSGYLYLEYGEFKDSCLINDKKFHFQGKVDWPTSAFLMTTGYATNDRNFYVENTDMVVNISLEKRKYEEYELNWVIIDTVIGTRTSELFYDFERFKEKNFMKSNWNQLYYSKLSEIFTEHPNNDYPRSLLQEVTFDSVLKPQELKNLYNKLEIKTIDSLDNGRLERIIFPERFIGVGDNITDFELPNQFDFMVNTQDFRGTFLLIDFWASWCLPCRKQFPELNLISNKYEEQGFRVLGVSIDDNIEKWKTAIKTDSLKWVNVIDGDSLNDKVEVEYGIFSIPSNLLINPEGKIVEKNISLELLETKLREIFRP